eukprot:Skav206510  [mRNA]  locus=scaffold2251:113674:131412:- [translate_table: standard]
MSRICWGGDAKIAKLAGPAHVHGRSKRSKQKVAWRLKQGPPLAHKNWDFPSRLRVSSGIAKRRRLEQPAGVTVRPTMERVREALFNQVTSMHLFEDRSVRVLDLCAGTGSLGIEALSRGAAECIYVDTSKECAGPQLVHVGSGECDHAIRYCLQLPLPPGGSSKSLDSIESFG